jgi:hypothetical protein
MALLDIINKDKQPSTPPPDPNKLNATEIQFVLQLLKQATLRGEQVELFYSLVVKLQNQFLEQTNKAG